MTYAAVLQNLKTGRITAELPIERAKASAILNAPGSLDVTMALGITSAAITVDAIAERANALFLVRDDTVVGEGIIETSDADVSSNSMTLSCLGWHHYLRNLFLRKDVSVAGMDQADLAKRLVEYAVAKPGAIQFATSNVAMTGRTRDREWFGWERHSIGELIDNLAAVIDGFHFRYRSTRGTEGYSTEFLVSYPASGRPTNYVLELGGNVELLGMTGDGGAVTNSVEMIGSGQGDEAPIVARVDSNALDSMPLWESVQVHSDISRTDTLADKADRRLVQGRRAVRIPKIRIGADVEPRIGSYLCGDRIRVRGAYGLLEVDADFVITQIDLTVEPTSEVVELTVAPVEQFAA